MESSAQKLKSRWTRAFYTTIDRRNDEEKFICDICKKELPNPSNLSLHHNAHQIERPFKCEICQVSFNTRGHLNKHQRSTAHEQRVTMTQAFGAPTDDNPRPYKCVDCDVAFRKHGHLAKHLRSKSHIVKMETNGLVPIGTYAMLEKSGPEVRDRLVTTNCELSLQSLRSIALLHPDWSGTSSISSEFN